MITAEELLKPISEDKPCGEDLYYDPSFQELEGLMKGKEETQFSKAEDPDWKKLYDRCVELYGRSKDLRVATAMCLAAVKVDGLAGLHAALVALKELLERYWEPIYPLLDPDDGHDPLYRINVIAALSTPRGTYGDPMRFLDRLCEAPLTRSVQLGSFSLADLARSEEGKPGPEGQAAPSKEQIEAAFRDTDPEELTAIHRLAVDMVQTVTEVDTFLTDTVGADKAPNLDLLSGQLKEIEKAVVPYLPAGTVEPVTGGETAGAAGEAGGAPAAKGISGAIQSRQDVIRMLEKICQYYSRTEPASPVPNILKRAQRWVEMDFLTIIKDLCPDAESTVRTVTGEKAEE
jgi:type VI secretion system protein ImpA